ncbi:MAG: PEP-CTERM sorting domain-containing protein [Okeania sp. SIO3B5]|uniref:PEP-CTERM sorting domain-containing protein n=1 Tax=Okeania sp. SIO3B5 TaxID=2607811 RepID=UPI0013FF366E|nr:PEP-CTERM sorting domain-containing protein [Okeania sp. SIO3B5]NEO53817.1 PEP-CTERM sorting domain-containing protein [Okeania sp. SIO3B5]
MKNQIVASIAALPFALGTAFAGAGVANAAALTGEFHIASGVSIPGGISNIFLTQDSLTFQPIPTPVLVDPDPVNGGSFNGFNSALISEIISFSGNNVNNPFLDLGNSPTGPGIVMGAPDPSLTDGLNVFNLTEASYNLSQTGANVSVDVALWGYFESANGHTSKGAGSLTFQIINDTVASVESQLASGETIGDITFSGGLFASTPEPTVLFGLGVVTAGLVASRRQKNS